MYSEKLEKLIEMALADGVLTEKEKQVLFKNAVAEGIDLDEFEVVLEARLYEKTQKQNNEKASASPQSNRLSDIRKCPACGAIAESFATKCPDCGTEFRNIEISHNIIKFFDKITEIDLNKQDVVEKNHVSFGTILKWLFFFWILIPLKLFSIVFERRPKKWTTTDSRKEALILNFPVPASREDILEFLTLSASRISSLSYINVFSETWNYEIAWNKIWFKKMEHIYSKAFISMKEDKKTYEEITTIVNNARNQMKSNNRKATYIFIAGLLIIILFFIFIFLN